MTKTHYVSSFDDKNVYDKLKENYVNIGDTIEYLSNNQEDYAKYIVIEINNEKNLRQIETICERLFEKTRLKTTYK